MIAIVKYNAGNIRSVENALLRLGYDCIVTDDKKTLIESSKVIFPGVGEAKSAMKYLIDKGLYEVLLNLKQPVLGICLGLQLMCSESEEGNTKCLGIFKNKVRRFEETDLVPHMGWNLVMPQSDNPLVKNLEQGTRFYFTHSYYVELENQSFSLMKTNYGIEFESGICMGNIYGVQFHPEKSHRYGCVKDSNS